MALPPEKGPLTPADFEHAAQQLGVDVPVIRAVAEVESRGAGFLPSGEPKILYERHLFDRFTNGTWRNVLLPGVRPEHAQISWPQRGGYGPLSLQHKKLQRASELDREAALRACSWGLFQILGDNWKACGFPSLQAFVNAAYESSAAHLRMFVGFIEHDPDLHASLRSHNFLTLASIYNAGVRPPRKPSKSQAAKIAQYAGLMRTAHKILAGGRA